MGSSGAVSTAYPQVSPGFRNHLLHASLKQSFINFYPSNLSTLDNKSSDSLSFFFFFNKRTRVDAFIERRGIQSLKTVLFSQEDGQTVTDHHSALILAELVFIDQLDPSLLFCKLS